MSTYLLKRILRIPFVLLAISVVVFMLSRFVPQDPVESILQLEGKFESDYFDDENGEENYIQTAKKHGYDKALFYFTISPSHYPNPRAISPQSKVQENTLLHTKKGFFVPKLHWHGVQNQYHHWLKNIFRGDFGNSFIDGRNVRVKISEALKWTLFLVIVSLIISSVVGIYFGLFNSISSSYNYKNIAKLVSYFLYSIPIFWLATMLLVFFTTDEYGSWTNIFPSASFLTPTEGGFISNFIAYGKILILPIIVYCLHDFSYIGRQMESSIQNEIDLPYAKTALSKGHTFTSMVKTHGFKNALLPIITLLSSALPASIAGSVVIETIFNIPGIGRLIYISIQHADWNVVFGIVLLVALITTISYLIADLLYSYVDPRIRFN